MSDLMAIGDSLFNGVRSLSINATLAQWSAPSQLAKALGVGFDVPDYPAPVLMDMETWVHGFPFNLSHLSTSLLQNLQLWQGAPKSALPRFDNIAIASSTYSDMWLNTPAVAEASITRIMADIQQGRSTVFDKLGDLFFAFNTRFLLNPQNDPVLRDKSSLDLVTDRQPKRLVVSIGANNGLWNMAFNAQACPGLGQVDGLFGPKDMAALAEFVDRLTKLPPGVERIYVNALPPASCTGVMMPFPPAEIANKPGKGKYFAKYENRFGFNYATLTGAQVAQNDAVVKAVNEQVATLAKADPRIQLVPTDAAIAALNWKTDPTSGWIDGGEGRVISNEMLDDYWFGEEERWSGGIMGLDGMHPTIVGYNQMAKCIMETVVQTEGAVVVKGQLPTVAQALAADTLISRFPLMWNDIMDIWRDIRIISAGRAQAPAHANTADVERLMKHVDFKLN